MKSMKIKRKSAKNRAKLRRQKKEQLLKKQLKKQYTKNILKKLAQQQTQISKDIQSKLESFKDIGVLGRKRKKREKQIQHDIKMATALSLQPAENASKSITTSHNNDDIEMITDSVEKRLKSASPDQDQHKIVNIFAQNINKASKSREMVEEVDQFAAIKEDFGDLFVLPDSQSRAMKNEIQLIKRERNEIVKNPFELDLAKERGQTQEEIARDWQFSALKDIQYEEIRDVSLEAFLQKTQNTPSQELYINQKFKRSHQIQEQRKRLPILMREDDIMDTIQNNLVTIICGDTGSGKSTQVPQFLYEAGFSQKGTQTPGLIGITQPRRIACQSLAKRIAQETGLRMGEEVAYQVRFDSKYVHNKKNRIKFMTEGILLNELTSDFLLQKYSIIVIDEAHERKVETDILLGILSRVINLRTKIALQQLREGQHAQTIYPLRLVIMSATLRVKDFTENRYLFPKDINIVNVEARTFPVTIFHNKRTKDDYFDQALKKCVKIHQKLPHGKILVFLTGQKEILEFAKQLEHKLSALADDHIAMGNDDNDHDTNNSQIPPSPHTDYIDSDIESIPHTQNPSQSPQLNNPNTTSDLNQPPSTTQTQPTKPTKHQQLLAKKSQKRQSPHLFKILPLFSKLPQKEQDLVFKSYPSEQRVIIVATNVAETSLTIPEVKYVIDSGKEKVRVFNSQVQTSKFEVRWISQASGSQRAGRAGRTGPGYCYRLYSSAVFANVFKKYTDPEILNTPLEKIALQLKCMGIKDIYKFPFPSPPPLIKIDQCLTQLTLLKAVSNYDLEQTDELKKQMNSMTDINSFTDASQITQLGKILNIIPLSPKYAKLLLLGRQKDCLGYTLLLVAGMSVEELFKKNFGEFVKEKEVEQGKKPQREKRLQKDSDDEFPDEDPSLQNEAQAELRKQIENTAEIIRMQKERSKQRREFIKSHKGKFKHYFTGDSDLFVLMNIVGEFIAHLVAKCSETKLINPDLFFKIKHNLTDVIWEFAQSKGLISKALIEIYLTIQQLISILDQIIEDQAELKALGEFFQRKAYQFPSMEEQGRVIEILIECFPLNVARRIAYMKTDTPSREQQLKGVNQQVTQKVVYCYESMQHYDRRCFLSPFSYLHMKKPQFVLFSHVLETKKLYLQNITHVKDISMLYKHSPTRSEKIQIQQNPEPFYSKKQDCILATASTTFGPKNWPLERFLTEFDTTDIMQYYWFARFLLEGKLYKRMAMLKSYYIQDPTKTLKLANLSIPTQRLVNSLIINKVNSKHRLEAMWDKDHNYLKSEVTLWLQPANALHSQSSAQSQLGLKVLNQIWPPVKQQHIS